MTQFAMDAKISFFFILFYYFYPFFQYWLPHPTSSFTGSLGVGNHVASFSNGFKVGPPHPPRAHPRPISPRNPELWTRAPTSSQCMPLSLSLVELTVCLLHCADHCGCPSPPLTPPVSPYTCLAPSPCISPGHLESAAGDCDHVELPTRTGS